MKVKNDKGTYLRQHPNELAAKARDCTTDVVEAPEVIIAALLALEISLAMIMRLVAVAAESIRQERPPPRWEADLPTAPAVLGHYQIFSN